MTKKCLTCKSTIIDELESGIDDDVPRLLNCDDKYNPNKTELKKKTPTISEIEVKIPIKSEKNTWVFYWASLPKKEIEIKGREEAYGDESNSGLLETDSEGKATLILNCPQPYRVNNLTYPRHVHYTTLTKDNVWSDKIKTMVVYCYLDKEQFTKALQSKDHIIINALPEESFREQSIDGTYNLPVESLNPSNRDDKVNDFMDTHIKKYPDLMDLIETNKMDEKDIPIITYCQGHECSASKELANHIMNAGYSNVVEYPGGIDEWFNNSSDDSSDEEITFFEDDSKYNLNNKYETIIINDVKYKHQLDDLNYILDEDDQKVGELIDNKIVWDTEQEKINNEFLSEEDEEDDDKDEEDDDKDEDDDDKDEDDDDKDEEDTSDSETSDDETSSSSSSSSSSSDEDEEEKDEGKKGGADAYNGGSSITKKEYDTLFRGWGFSFL